ncbi:uncharacterized protein ATNIH1004_003986 [Aspergillus tanneri]|uniref:Uncharacterized protein n=1 Tax=Aspergillus tanneri TaxID=1220188 RepID=A0A5M9MT94_9EURO|nr:uncharacterized protein ATNIH1004_003986 [Aspergillus tanneri]KAA8648103.1 hypothetical protein ATNIH1004_003986 [Aspergillus tanneri]
MLSHESHLVLLVVEELIIWKLDLIIGWHVKYSSSAAEDLDEQARKIDYEHQLLELEKYQLQFENREVEFAIERRQLLREKAEA